MNKTIPLRMCDACLYKRIGEKTSGTREDWCYIFMEEPTSAYCANFAIDKTSEFAASAQSGEKP